LQADHGDDRAYGLRESPMRPAIAAVDAAPLHEVRLPRIDARLVENLQSWADDEKESWSEEI